MLKLSRHAFPALDLVQAKNGISEQSFLHGRQTSARLKSRR